MAPPGASGTPDGAIGRVAAPRVKRSRRCVPPGLSGARRVEHPVDGHRQGHSRVDGAIDPPPAGSTAPSAGTDPAGGQAHEAAVMPLFSGRRGRRPAARSPPGEARGQAPAGAFGHTTLCPLAPTGTQPERLRVTSEAHAANVTREPGGALAGLRVRAHRVRGALSGARRAHRGGGLAHPVAVVPAAGSAGRTGRVKRRALRRLRRPGRSARLTGPDDGERGKGQAQGSSHPGARSTPAGGTPPGACDSSGAWDAGWGGR